MHPPKRGSSKPLALAGLTILIFSGLAAPCVRAQSVWSGGDDRGSYWSLGRQVDDQGTVIHVGNWSGGQPPAPGADVILGPPGGTVCDVTITLGSLTVQPGGALAFAKGQTLTVANTNFATDGAMTGGSTYTNTGTLLKSAGTGTYTFTGDMTVNSAPGTTIAVDAGTLQLPGGRGLFDTVTFDPAAGTLIDLVSENADSSAFDNIFQGTLTNGGRGGTVRLSQGSMGGTLNYVANALPCTLAFTGNVFQWTGGNIGFYQQGAPFTNTGVVNLSGDATKETDAVFTNQGLVIQSGAGAFNVGDNHSGGSFTNSAGATYDLQSDAAIGQSGYPFNNVGLFKKSGGTGTSVLSVAFNNQGGTVEVDSGTLQLPVGQTSTSTGGTFNVAAGAVLDLGDGQHFTGTFTGGGAGTVQLSQGSLYGDSTTVTTFNFSGSMFQWTGGIIGGGQSGHLFTNVGTITLAGDADKTTFGILTNQGTIIQTGTGNFDLGQGHSGGSLVNAAGGVYNLQSDAGMTNNDSLTNAGLFEKTAGTGTSTINEELTNSGTITVSAGMLSFSANVDDISDTTLTEGTWNVFDPAALTFTQYAGGITVNQASVTLSGPNSSFPAINALADNQSSFSLLAQRQFTTAGALSNEGTIFLDAGSTLHVSGNFTASDPAPASTGAAVGGKHLQAATSSTLHFTIGGTAAQGAQSSGIMQVAGEAKIAGLLEIVLANLTAAPTASDSLTLLSARSVTGSFDNAPTSTRLPTADGRGSFLVTYGSGSIGLSRFLATGQSASTPMVTVAVAGDGDAVEGGENGKVAIRRDGDLTGPLVVRYKVTGSAVAGTDYKPLAGVATIPAGAAQVKIKIKPIDHTAVDGTRVAKVKLKAATDGSYLLGATTTAKVKIIDHD